MNASADRPTPETALTRRDLDRELLGAAIAFLAFSASASAAWTATPVVPLFDFAVAGGRYHGLRAARGAYTLGERLNVAAEFDNPYDANAVAVLDTDGARLGYLSRRANPPVTVLLREGGGLEAVVVGPECARAGTRSRVPRQPHPAPTKKNPSGASLTGL